MTLNRGTVLGSTKDRIQISDGNQLILPGEGSTDPVVIQGRYAQLCYYNSGTSTMEPMGTRGYVQSYDASYGHIYPLAGSFTNDLVNSASAVQIYKYSNDPNAITANDTVRCATSANISYYNTSYPDNLSSVAMSAFDGITVVKGDYVLVRGQTSYPKQNGIYLVDSVSSSTVNLVRSGSYKTWGNFIGKVIYVREGSTYGGKNYVSQARAGGTLYSSQTSGGDSPLSFAPERPILLFPSLIKGTATFFAQYLANLGTVVDGVAAKDGDTALVYNYSGGSPYGFIYAYQNGSWFQAQTTVSGVYHILYGVTYGDCYINNNDYRENIMPFTAAILHNGTTYTYIKPYTGLEKGMALYFTNHQKITYSGGTQKEYIVSTGVDTKFWKVTHAALSAALPSYGDTLGSTTVPYTYDIKSYFKESDENPFSLYDNPYLKLGNGNGGFSDIATYQPYLVKKTEASDEATDYFLVYYNSHGDFFVRPTVVSGYYDYDDDIFYDENDDPVTPATGYLYWDSDAHEYYIWDDSIEEYQYVSDYEGTISDDLTTFYISGSPITPSTGYLYYATNTQAYYQWNDDNDIFELTAYHFVTSEDENFQVIVNNTPFYVRAPSITAYSKRQITLQGHYYQWQQGSWESYRWMLTDSTGNVLQDTGKKYDKTMSVTFYGLSNDTTHNKNIYYAILLVEDSLGQSLSFSIKIIVDKDSQKTVDIPFYAEYDCGTHSVILSYQNYVYVKPYIVTDASSGEALAYVAGNQEIAALWDDSLLYTENPLYGERSSKASEFGLEGWANITGKNSNSYEEIYNIVQRKSDLSETEKLGIGYQYTFDKKAYVAKTDGTANIILYNDTSDTGQFSYQTRLRLSDNFAGDLIEAAIDCKDNVNQLHLALRLPTDFTTLDGDTLSSYRYNIAYDIFTNNTSAENHIRGYLLKNGGGDRYQWRSDPAHNYYFLQSHNIKNHIAWDTKSGYLVRNEDDAYIRYLTFNSPNLSDTTTFYPFYLMADLDIIYADESSEYLNYHNVNNKRVAINSSKFLGNTCLVSNADVALAGDSLVLNSMQGRLSMTYGNNVFLKYAPVYWAENRPRVKMYKKTGVVEYPMNFLYGSNDLTYTEETGALISWPAAEDEQSHYWEEMDKTCYLLQGITYEPGYPYYLQSPAKWSTVFGKSKVWGT